jgi:hypothetical protein
VNAGLTDFALSLAIAVIFIARVSAIAWKLRLPGIRDPLPRLKANAEAEERA